MRSPSYKTVSFHQACTYGSPVSPQVSGCLPVPSVSDPAAQAQLYNAEDAHTADTFQKETQQRSLDLFLDLVRLMETVLFGLRKEGPQKANSELQNLPSPDSPEPLCVSSMEKV